MEFHLRTLTCCLYTLSENHNVFKKFKVKNDVLKRQVNEVTILQKKVTESARELAARGQQPLESEID